MAASFVCITVWCLLAACYLDLAKTATVPTCVHVYHEFEEAAITNSSANVHSLFSVLYSPNHPLPFSVVIHYQVQLPNGTTARVSSDTGCPSELWMWTYSPVFLWFEPSLLNKLTLYAMNGVVRWKSPTVTLTVPLPCQNVSYSFLNEMTMAVSWNTAIFIWWYKLIYCGYRKRTRDVVQITGFESVYVVYTRNLSGLNHQI